MQLKKGQSIRGALATATCTLLGTATDDAAAFGTDAPWEFDSALLLYSETDRVEAIEPVFKARKELDDDEFINLRLVFDSLTGASASGAVPMPFPQTFTQPSGKNAYTADPNEPVLDPSFLDSRVALSGEWEVPHSRLLKGVYGAYFSNEYDYTSLGASATLARDNADKSRTYTAGLSVSFDTVEPVGGAPVGMTLMPEFPDVKAIQSTSEDKTVVDFLFGVTQILDQRSLIQLNYSIGNSDGYLTDPYKILSVIDDNPLSADYGEIINQNTGDGPSYRYENRPDTRLSQSLYTKYVHQFDKDVIYFSYRYFWDDWGIDSHTFDVRYRYELGGGHYLQPHVRQYIQSAADFYKPYLLASDEPNVTSATEASADYRLGDMTTTTIGLLYGLEFSKTSEFTTRLEFMKQSGDEPDKFGELNNQELFPDVDVVIFQVGYSFTF
ncbi:MAG: DUF3570 domain-containing protein [Gammaproteobacteria bacterium]|jgi:hypothetical protein